MPGVSRLSVRYCFSCKTLCMVGLEFYVIEMYISRCTKTACSHTHHRGGAHAFRCFNQYDRCWEHLKDSRTCLNMIIIIWKMRKRRFRACVPNRWPRLKPGSPARFPPMKLPFKDLFGLSLILVFCSFSLLEMLPWLPDPPTQAKTKGKLASFRSDGCHFEIPTVQIHLKASLVPLCTFC